MAAYPVYRARFFGNDNISLEPNDSLYLDFLAWKGEGTCIPLSIDHGSKGSIDKILELKDESDFYKDSHEKHFTNNE